MREMNGNNYKKHQQLLHSLNRKDCCTHQCFPSFIPTRESANSLDMLIYVFSEDTLMRTCRISYIFSSYIIEIAYLVRNQVSHFLVLQLLIQFVNLVDRN